MNTMSPYHVAVAAEAFAAGVFAQAGYDVSVQYGANQPEYDLIVTQGNRFLKVSVKGSQDGGWGLNQSYKNKNVTYHQAVENWMKEHQSKTIYCLVQFKNINIGECPRLYLATIEEIAKVLKNARNGHGETILWEHHAWTRGIGANTIDELPITWRFSQARVEQLLDTNAIS